MPNVGVVGHHLHGDGWRISHPGDYGEEDELGTTSLVHVVAFSGIVRDAMLFCDIQNFSNRSSIQQEFTLTLQCRVRGHWQEKKRGACDFN